MSKHHATRQLETKLVRHCCDPWIGFSAYFGLQLAGILPTATSNHATTQNQVAFTRIKTVNELEQILAQAKADNKAVMFDFYADWCVACKEFEKYTFHDPKVSAQLANIELIQVDVTAATADDIALMQNERAWFTHHRVLGSPRQLPFTSSYYWVYECTRFLATSEQNQLITDTY